MPIEWTPALAIGEPTIDEQHRQLFTWLNDLLKAMGEGKGRGEIEHVLSALTNYTVMHFGHEESCARRAQCPAAAENEARHREFVAMVAAYRRDYEQHGATSDLVLRIKEELAHWITAHIKGTDMKLAPCLGKGS